MHILVLDGTRYFGIPMVEELLAMGHDVTIATRGNAGDGFGGRVCFMAVRNLYWTTKES